MTRKPTAAADRAGDRQGVDVVAGDDLDDDGEDEQAEHVVGHGRAEHDPRLGRGEGAQVAEHPRRDADARGRQGGAEEQRRVAGFAEPDADDAAEQERHGDADDGDGHRRSPDATELGEIHLHADLDEQQQDAELGRARRSARCAAGIQPSSDGPMRMPTTISPTTAGTRIRSHSSAASLAATRITARSSSIVRV